MVTIHSGAWRRLGVGLIVASVGVALLCWWLGAGVGVDSGVYRAGGLALLHGDPLYGSLRFLPNISHGLPFTYPPVAAVLFLPLAALPPQLVWGVFAVLTVLGLVLVLRTSVTVAGPPWLVPALGFGVFALEPVWRGLGLGQINVVLMALVVLDVLVLPRNRYRGVLVGLAAAIKLTPLIFVLHLLVTGRRADAARALGTFLGLNVVCLLVLPRDTLTYWRTQLLGGDNATGASFGRNQSLNGLIQRIVGHSGLAFPLAVLAGLACLAIALPMARTLERRGDALGALLVTAFCGLLVSPISWTHHWVWLVPLAGLLVSRAVRRPSMATILPIAGLAALGTGICTMMPVGNDAEQHWNILQLLLGNAYVLGTLAVLAVLAIRLPGTRPSTVDFPELSRASGTPAASRG